MPKRLTELQRQQRHAAKAVDKRIKKFRAESKRATRENQKRIAKIKREHRATLTERVDAFEYVLRRLEGAVLRIERSVERQATAIAHEIAKVHSMVPTVADVAALATTKAVDRLIQRGARS